MLFPTITFAVFFLLVFVGNWLLMPRQKAWKPFMLVVSLVFYGWWDWRFVLLLALSAVANQFFARWIAGMRPGAAGRKWALAAAVAANLGVLGWFKYYGFFVTSVVNVFDTLRSERRPAAAAHRPAARHLVPHVPRAELRHRRVPRHACGRRRCSTSRCTSPSSRTSPPAPSPAPRSSCRSCNGPRDPRNVDTARAFFLIFGGLIKKMLIADYLRDPHRQRRVHHAGPVLVARGAARHHRLLGADLLRLQRLRGHRHRHLAAAGVRAARTTSTRRTRRARCRSSGAAGT